MDTVGSYSDQIILDQIKIHTEPKTGGQFIRGAGNIGADDKCGIAIAMELYEAHPERFSLLFTTGEETGGTGVQGFINEHGKLLSKVNYCVIADRNGFKDVIGSRNDYCTEDFEEEVMKTMSQFGYQATSGIWCDANHLSDHMNCINVSCGYYQAHSSSEYVSIEDFTNAYNAIEKLSEVFNKLLPKPNKIITAHRYGGYSTTIQDYSPYIGMGKYEEDIEVYGDEVIVNRNLIMYSPSGRSIQLEKGEYYIMMDSGLDENGMVSFGADPDDEIDEDCFKY